MNNKKIFIIAGESSGDQHAANYVKEHKKINPNIKFSAIGQDELKKEGVDIIYDSELISVVGIIEVIAKYRKIKNALNIAYKHIVDDQPNLVVLVDYVEFNLKIAKFAKNKNIPVLFYVAPQVWAWREKRIQKIINIVDHLAVVFPFEEHLFKKYTKAVTYVGHPLADDNNLSPSKTEYKDRTTFIGIFPGSRESEIKNNLHLMIDSVQIRKNETIFDKNIKIFYSNDTAKQLISRILPEGYGKLLVSGKNLDEIKNCRKAITASGTITLELALMNIPMIIMYRLSPITFFIMKNLVKLKYIGLVNLILGDSLGSKPIVKEFIQPGYNDIVKTMVELNNIEYDSQYREAIEESYKDIRKILRPGASSNVAKLAEHLMN
jgi:lipid-A-disaccharide synthase